jgi:hypothetical protein
MSGLFSSVQNAAIPMLLNFLQSNEAMLQSGLVSKLAELKISNPTQYNLALTNWRKLNTAVEASAVAQPIPTPPPMMGGQPETGPTGPEMMTRPIVEPTPPIVEPPPLPPTPSPPIVEPTGPTGPTVPEATGPSFTSETGPTGPSIVDRISSYFSSSESGPTGASGGKKHRKRKTAKQHRKRTHRVKHRKH